MQLSSFVIILAALGAIAWLAFMVATSVRGKGREEVPPNLAPFKTDDEMESRRLDRWLAVAVVLSAFLALALPIYFLGEQDRQESFVDEFHEIAVERGHELVIEFACSSCHGPDLGGGVAAYTEKRSGVSVSWDAPALNDIYYRYSRDEVKYWLIYGRANSPMPAWGLEGGGPMNDEQLEEILDYLETIQIPQEEVLAQIDGRVTFELGKLENADATMATAITNQRQLIQDIRSAPELAPVAFDLAEQMAAVLDGASTGLDTDGDGLSDTSEGELTALSAEAADRLAIPKVEPAAGAEETTTDTTTAETTETTVAETTETTVAAAEEDPFNRLVTAVELDPTNPASVGGEPDLVVARRTVSSVESVASSLGVSADNIEGLLPQAEAGLVFLEDAAAERRWAVDLQGVADATFGGDVEAASEAVGLYNAYCARCHTAGYSAGLPYQQEPGSGALGPALWNGRSKVQFLDEADMVDFIINGSEQGAAYGVNGMGRGWMPGFGEVLSREQIELIVRYERGDMSGMGGGVAP